jgi:hypothetical protein
MGYGDYNQNNNSQHNKGLLASGWRPLNRDLDWEFLWNIVVNDPWNLTKRTVDFASDVADFQKASSTNSTNCGTLSPPNLLHPIVVTKMC